MIPGTLCDTRIFQRQTRALRGVADVRMVNFNDLKSIQDWPARVLRRLPPHFSIMGFSLGGIWALELLRQVPHRVERLALVASNANGASAAGRRKSARLWRLWRASGFEGVVKQVEPNYFHHPLKRNRYAGLIRDMARRTSSQAARAEFAWAATRPESFDTLAQFMGPLLVVSGARDQVCKPSMQRSILQAQPKGRWIELPRIGHFAPLEAAAQLNSELLKWLASPS